MEFVIGKIIIDDCEDISVEWEDSTHWMKKMDAARVILEEALEEADR